MGNIIGKLTSPQQRVAYQPNIPVNCDNMQNDLNNPHSKQMFGMIFNFIIPMFCIVVLAYERFEHENMYKQMAFDVEYVKTLEEKIKKLENLQDIQNAVNNSTLFITSLQNEIKAIENDENEKFNKKIYHMRNYESHIESIEDIRCSMFKSSGKRKNLQDRVLLDLSEDKTGLNTVMKPKHLQEIFDHDYHFCANTKQNNGKLRFLYVNHWRLQLEIQKNVNIRKRVNQLLNAYK